VAGHVVGLGGDVLGQLRAEVLERVFQLNFARYGDTVQGDRGATELLVQHDVSATRPEGYLDRVGELVHPALERPTSDLVEVNLLRHQNLSGRKRKTPRHPGRCGGPGRPSR